MFPVFVNCFINLGLGLMLSIFQIIYCSKPWSLFTLSSCGCATKTKSQSKSSTLTQANNEVLVIRSYYDSKLRQENDKPALGQKLETIKEVTREQTEIDGSLRNLRHADIYINSSKINVFNWRRLHTMIVIFSVALTLILRGWLCPLTQATSSGPKASHQN